ncbi:MAG: AAA family ATPase [Candidatus Poribacteria bacterium]|nr:AAA family ATPase [Candidatus Poribacteria bacterium]
MSEEKAFLEKVHIKNFMSLRDVTLPLKPLTIFVGPNASGKSNTVTALYRLHNMMVDERLSSDEFNRDTLWETEVPKISFHLHTKVEESRTLYHLEVKLEPDLSFRAEQLSVNDANVISIQDGQGTVRDENGENGTPYNSDELALRSAGNYGNKPITRALAEFMKEWKFYDFSPDLIRSSLTRSILLAEKEIREFPKLDSYGLKLPEVLCNWEKNFPERFKNVSDSLVSSTNRYIDSFPVMEENQLFSGNQLFLLEGYREPIPLKSASDGMLRLIAYYTLLNEPELPPLIAIEEPERNFHPGALTDIANVLEQIAQYSQVIITTHSSQLLGAFNPESLGDSLGVLLLRNRPGFGTEVLNLEDYRGKKKALDGWIADFGIGSAVFDSGLLPDEMEDTAECQA